MVNTDSWLPYKLSINDGQGFRTKQEIYITYSKLQEHQEKRAERIQELENKNPAKCHLLGKYSHSVRNS